MFKKDEFFAKLSSEEAKKVESDMEQMAFIATMVLEQRPDWFNHVLQCAYGIGVSDGVAMMEKRNEKST